MRLEGQWLAPKQGGAFDVPKASGLGTEPIATNGITDPQGRVVSKGLTSDGYVTYGASKAGFYESRNLHYKFKSANEGRWVPWNPELAVVLKPIVKPIPMYAKRIDVRLAPDNNIPIGFDLEVGDLVSPYGAGKQSDFIFSVEREILSSQDYRARLRLTFSRVGDGLIPVADELAGGSVFQLPREAPLSSYSNERIWKYSGKPIQGATTTAEESAKVCGYIFRVRTDMDGNGNIQRALYGKISGDFRLHVGNSVPNAGIGFVYYLNPNINDRNLEFDVNKNLFGRLRPLENVTLP